VGEFAYIILLAFIKFSILRMYYRIFPTKYMRWAGMIVGVMMLAWCVGSIFASLFQCNPISAAWDKSLLEQGGQCVDQGTYFIGVAGMSMMLAAHKTLLPIVCDSEYLC
jgi:hypothetical protein